MIYKEEQHVHRDMSHGCAHKSRHREIRTLCCASELWRPDGPFSILPGGLLNTFSRESPTGTASLEESK